MIAISRTGRLLRRVVRVACERPALTVVLSLALAGGGIAYALSAITFKTSTLHLLPPGQRYATLYRQYADDFGELDDIVVVVQGSTVDESKAYAARLVRELRTSPIRFQRVAYRIDPKRFEGRALLYLSTEELTEIRDKIFDYQEFMEAFAATPTLGQLIEGINQQIAAAFLAHFFDIGVGDGRASTDLRFLRQLLTQIEERTEHRHPYRSPWGTLFSFGRAEEADSGYFLSDDKSLLFILVEPASQKGSFTGDRTAIEIIRQRIADLRAEFSEVHVGVTGPPTISNDEMTAAFRDSEVATLLAFALTLGLLLVAFRRVGKPLLMLAVLAVSLAWSMGIVTLTVGHLTIFSVMFISIVVGIGIDYGIYFLFRYEEEIFLGRNLREALELTAARSGPGILLGAVTAAGTFYVLMLTDFRGIREFGFISGTALLMAFLAMLTFFPALLVLVDRRHATRPRGRIPRAIELERIRVPLLEWLARHPKTVLTAAGLLTAFSLWAVRTVGFDYNLLNLQAEGTESVVWERKILATAGRSGFTALASATSLDELRRKHEAFERLPSVSEVDSVLMLIPDRQLEKAKIIQDFAPLVAPVRVGRPRSLDLDHLVAALETLKRRFDVAVAEAGPGGPDREVAAVRAQVGTLVEKLNAADRDMVEPALNHFQAQLYWDFIEKFHTLQRNLRPRPVTLRDVPAELRRKFIGASGRFLLQIHPKVDIWDRQGATRFVEELRSVDPDVTGPPIITYEAIRLMEKAYRQGTAYAFVLVAVLAALMIRRLRETCLALVPLLLGTLWTVGLMYVFDLKFNLANVWGLPLIIGAAAEYGLNVVVRFMEGRAHGGPLLARSTVMAVVFNGLTTIAGFGSLLVAQHQGIWSLGLLLTIGACASLASSLLVLPVLIRLVTPTATLEGRQVSVPAA
ncbi:MAG: MMPL family transporter [Candidatus Rokubacteria bacterium]|nr:MMPL family transporter [Candidatus Rokubacteria bacterium]